MGRFGLEQILPMFALRTTGQLERACQLGVRESTSENEHSTIHCHWMFSNEFPGPGQ